MLLGAKIRSPVSSDQGLRKRVGLFYASVVVMPHGTEKATRTSDEGIQRPSHVQFVGWFFEGTLIGR